VLKDFVAATRDDARAAGRAKAVADRDDVSVLVIATGSEVSLAVQAAEHLAANGIPTRVVSMAVLGTLRGAGRGHRESVLPQKLHARLAIEAASPMGWERRVGDRGDVIGVDRFGASAPGGEVMRRYGFEVGNVVERARRCFIISCAARRDVVSQRSPACDRTWQAAPSVRP